MDSPEKKVSNPGIGLEEVEDGDTSFRHMKLRLRRLFSGLEEGFLGPNPELMVDSDEPDDGAASASR